MDIQQTSKVLMYLSTAYPSFKLDNMKATIEVWADMFIEDDFGIVMAAVKALIASSDSQFAPSIGEIKSMMRKLTVKESLNEGEAWAMVERAIGQSSYYAEEEFKKLPETIQKAVGSPSQLESWAKDENYCSSVVQSHFLNAYRQAEKQKEMLERIPVKVRELIASASEPKRIEVGA